MFGVFFGYWGLDGGGEGRDLAPPLPHPTPTPQTSCIAAPEKLDGNLKMAHI